MKTVGYTTPVTGATVTNATLTFDNQGLITAASSGSSGATITTKDEGGTLSSTVTTLDFVGAGVTASGAGATTTVTIPGAFGGAVPGYTTTVTAAGTTTLTNTSTSTQYFTGSASQTVVLPVVTTLVNGWMFKIVCTSTGTVTVQSSGLVALFVVPRKGWVNFICVDTTAGTGAASWSVEMGVGGANDSGAVRVGSGTAAGFDGVAIGSGATASGTGCVAIGALGSTNSISNSIMLNATDAVLSIPSSAYAFGLGIASSSVNPGTLGVSINGATFIIRKYTSDFASTVTAAGTTTLTVTSAQQQYFTGSTTQTVVLPVATTLANGFHFKIVNQCSTGNTITVNSSGGNLVGSIGAGSGAPSSRFAFLTCINTAGGTGTASWSFEPGL